MLNTRKILSKHTGKLLLLHWCDTQYGGVESNRFWKTGLWPIIMQQFTTDFWSRQKINHTDTLSQQYLIMLTFYYND